MWRADQSYLSGVCETMKLTRSSFHPGTLWSAKLSNGEFILFAVEHRHRGSKSTCSLLYPPNPATLSIADRVNYAVYPNSHLKKIARQIDSGTAKRIRETRQRFRSLIREGCNIPPEDPSWIELKNSAHDLAIEYAHLCETPFRERPAVRN